MTCDPSQSSFHVPDLTPPAEIPPLRFEKRLSLLNQVERHLDNVASSPAVAGFNRQLQQALELLRGSQARGAFDLSQESEAT
ncbi:MAG: DUF1501 domain-containing protein [Planctomycetaceae bacterium]|nr:DUF1501 domain-containing protein [Planctomycetaceae bacterium]